MSKMISAMLLSGVMVMTGCGQPELGNEKFADGQVQKVVRASEIKWSPCPPTLPKNCEMAVLAGHPKHPDMFTLRFHSTGELFMDAHTHPRDERVTVLKGRVAVAFGADSRREDAQEFGPDDYYINKRGEVHKVWVEEGMIMQITGIGPWQADYINKQ